MIEWEDMASLPNSDDLVWLYNARTKVVDGPRAPYPPMDPDIYTHWAVCDYPKPLPEQE